MNKELIRPLIHRNNPTIVEIGAHHAEDTVHFRLMYPKARIFIFEPDRRCAELIRSMGVSAVLTESAVSDRDGEEDFYPSGIDDKRWDGSGSLLKPSLHIEAFPHVTFGDPYRVSCVTLNSFFLSNELDFIDFLWMDVQGAEEKILRGGSEVFTAHVGAMFTEYCTDSLYEGCPNQKRILDLLPFHYEIVEDYPGVVCGDMLLKNKGAIL